jgi:hypothetical protein
MLDRIEMSVHAKIGKITSYRRYSSKEERGLSSIRILTSCISLNILVLTVDPGYPQGAPLQVDCVGVPLVGTLRSLLLLVFIYGCKM